VVFSELRLGFATAALRPSVYSVYSRFMPSNPFCVRFQKEEAKPEKERGATRSLQRGEIELALRINPSNNPSSHFAQFVSLLAP
jgi:hypothetical protein